MTPEAIFKILLGFGAVVVLWSRQRRAAASAAAAKAAPPARGDAEEEERTRRVQEEIRRKIALRQAQGQRQARDPGGWEPPASGPSRVPAARPGTAVPQPPIAALAPAPSNPDTPVLPSPRQARGLPADPGLSPMAGGLSPIEASPFRKDIAPSVHAQGRDWLAELRQRPEARRAILLREILGPPVGLR